MAKNIPTLDPASAVELDTCNEGPLQLGRKEREQHQDGDNNVQAGKGPEATEKVQQWQWRLQQRQQKGDVKGLCAIDYTAL